MGVALAIVIENDDPDGLSRIKVQFPMFENRPAIWARVVVPLVKGAEPSAPEIGTEVLCAFENNDIRSPYVLGALRVP
jgi:uncharacterized protein involved in type VI secretion and phage assembly